MRSRTLKSVLAGGVCALALTTAAHAEQREFAVPAGELSQALDLYIRQSGEQLIYRVADVRGMKTPGVSGELSSEEALARLLEGTSLTIRRDPSGLIAVASAETQAPQSGSAAGDGADSGTVEALIVTAQKREEDIQDVPIAISAFTQEQLENSQVAGGPDLMTQIPNVTFTKTNFTGYSVQIRGIGTQAVSATTDPAVAIAFNNTPFIRNRFFEQEFYDLQRVEVLRGPQGTLYGRNATAGVINILSARPSYRFEAKLSGDVANYNSTRLEGMINIPIVEDQVAFRLAGAWTKREGYATNQLTGKQIDGRDLWSVRATLRFNPTDAIDANLTYEHFEEDDDRLRSGKQLCKKDPTPTSIGGRPVDLSPGGDSGGTFGLLSFISQGCRGASLYSEESFQTPNGFALPYWTALGSLGLPVNTSLDPYLSTTQSRDLRVIESTIDPSYRATADIVHLQVNVDVSPTLTLTSETAYSRDFTFSTQDYNRFTTIAGAFEPEPLDDRPGLFVDGAFCDPQLGCSDRLLLGDLATADSQQFSQEFRLGSDFDGPVNFSAGVNFLRYDTEDKYYVFVNLLSLFAAQQWEQNVTPYVPGVSDNRDCMRTLLPGDPTQVHQVVKCIYMDPNPIERLNDQGHNYFLSKNPYRLISYAAFGEIYYNITEALKLTAGLRWTVDKKHAPEIPSWVMAAHTIGYPVAGVSDQEWREPTGRLTLDWKPDLGFTDETLLYASYAHGYKAGGANPPRPVIVTYGNIGADEGVVANSLTHPKTFEPEFVDAIEFGAKNTLLDGAATVNANVFYYDYKGYQISEIVNRAAVNRNFDAEVWGAELEADWRPLENLRFGLKVGYEKTRVGDGQSVIDLMDRTAGDPAYRVIKPFPSVPSNCIVPEAWLAENQAGGTLGFICNAYLSGTPAEGLENVPNNGEGIAKDLGGNELPNAPELTTTLTVDYTLPLPNEWLMTLHADLYRQSEAWTRIINSDPYDRLKPYENVNLAAIFTNEDAGWKVMAYVKNVFDKDSITGSFLNSDDTGLTTNVFLTEPRLYGLRVTKNWSGGWVGPFIGGGDGPAPLTVEIGASMIRTEAENERFSPSFVEDYDSPDMPFPLFSQDEDLDWGDGREVRLTYRPQGSPWSVSLGARGLRVNGTSGFRDREQTPGAYGIGDTLMENILSQVPDFLRDFYRDFLEPFNLYQEGPENFAETLVEERERQTIVEFDVGRELGIGGIESQARLGVRYASFDSETALEMHGAADYLVPEGWNLAAKYPASVTLDDAQVAAKRSFEGAGPQISWDAALALLGNEQTGRVTLDWSIGAGALFGRQKVDINGQATERVLSFDGDLNGTFIEPAADNLVFQTSEAIGGEPRSHSVTVPTFSGSLGLSYGVDRVKVSTGYRWERFFDVLDGGVDERQKVDRTIQGPFLKIAIGFGG